MGVRLDDLITGDDSSPDWPVIRDLLSHANPSQIAAAKDILSGGNRNEASGAARGGVIGLRGAGKSTLGKLVADRLGWTFVELNAEIERENALSVREIFAIYGQEGIAAWSRPPCGGSPSSIRPAHPRDQRRHRRRAADLRSALQAFYTVWLRARGGAHEPRARAGAPADHGDHASAMQELRAVLASREPLYARAAAQVDTSDIPVPVMLDG